MAAVPPSFPVPDFPAEMVTAVAADAARDAARVGRFLEHLGLGATPEQPRPLPAAFLLHLGAALRLLAWEAQGFCFHRQAGLPEARQAIRDAFRSLADPGADPTALGAAVLRLAVERFAWGGPRDLDADVALDDLTDDAALEALAAYLWATRHTGPAANGPQPGACHA
jgi:hypothetical protein